MRENRAAVMELRQREFESRAVFLVRLDEALALYVGARSLSVVADAENGGRLTAFLLVDAERKDV